MTVTLRGCPHCKTGALVKSLDDPDTITCLNCGYEQPLTVPGYLQERSGQRNRQPSINGVRL